jgi:hypothetical protein
MVAAQRTPAPPPAVTPNPARTRNAGRKRAPCQGRAGERAAIGHASAIDDARDYLTHVTMGRDASHLDHLQIIRDLLAVPDGMVSQEDHDERVAEVEGRCEELEGDVKRLEGELGQSEKECKEWHAMWEVEGGKLEQALEDLKSVRELEAVKSTIAEAALELTAEVVRRGHPELADREALVALRVRAIRSV